MNFNIIKEKLAIKKYIRGNYKDLLPDKIKKRVILLIIFITSVFFLRQLGTEWIGMKWVKDLGIDPVTYIFLTISPVILFLRISWRISALISIILLIFIAYFSINKYTQITENLAVLTFLLLTISVIQRLFELRNNKSQV